MNVIYNIFLKIWKPHTWLHQDGIPMDLCDALSTFELLFVLDISVFFFYHILISPVMYSLDYIKSRSGTGRAAQIAVRGWMNSGSYHFLWRADVHSHEIEWISWMIFWTYSQLCFSSEIQRLRLGDYIFFQTEILET